MTYPIATGADLAQKKILEMESEIAREHIYGNPFGNFSGESRNNIVQMIEDSSKGAGDTIYFPMADAQDPDVGVVLGEDTAEGQETSMRRTSDSLTIDYVRFGVFVPNRELGEIRSPIPVYEDAKMELMDKGIERLRNDIMDAAATGLTAVNTSTKLGAIVSGASSPAKHRALFGASESNYNSDLATAMATLDTTADLLTVSMIRQCVKKAKSMAGTYSLSSRPRRLKPATIEGDINNLTLREKYVLFTDSRSVYDLKNTDDFKALRDDMRRNTYSDAFTTPSMVVGEIENVIVVEIPEMERIGATGAGASSANVTHNLFCGAQAFGIGWGNRGEFRTREADYGKDVGVLWHSIRGQKMLKYTPESGSSYNLGLIHVFCATAN